MSIKRVVARVKIARRKRARAKAEEEVRKLGLARNKALKDAERATKVATAKEGLRLAKLKKHRAEAPSRKEAEEKHKRARVSAGKTIKRTVKGLKKLLKI